MNCELLRLQLMISFPKLNNVDSTTITTFSDAVHSDTAEVYGQSEILRGLKLGASDGKDYHPIIWTSSKQEKVSYSSYGAEILAASEAVAGGFQLKQALHALFPDRPLKHKLLVDSKSLFETISTLNQTGEYRPCRVLARMRKLSEAKKLNIVRWIPGSLNYGHVLTKRRIPLSQRHNAMLISGDWTIDMSSSCWQDADNSQ